jgi:16S rRNA (uracil1498-N3)-methyltransferase
MQYLYKIEAGNSIVEIDGDEYRYLFRARRAKLGDIIELRNLQDSKLYSYKVVSIDKKSAKLELIFAEDKEQLPAKTLVLGWCIIDPKSIEKILPSLNEIGVSKIVFIKCAYSQNNFKIKKDKLEKILINSSQQCGRSSLMQIDFANSIFDFLASYPTSYLLNFSNNHISKSSNIDSIVVGCEGGLGKDEIALFDSSKIVGFDSNLILKSESAALAVASKIIL